MRNHCSLWILLYCSYKCSLNVGTAGHDPHSLSLFLYTTTLKGVQINAAVPINVPNWLNGLIDFYSLTLKVFQYV